MAITRVRVRRLAWTIGLMLVCPPTWADIPPPSRLSAAAGSARRQQVQRRWLDCAVLWDQVAEGRTQDTPAARQHAEYARTVCLARLGLTYPALRAAGALAGQPAHPRARDAAVLFSELTRTVPAVVRVEDELPLGVETLLRHPQEEPEFRLLLLLGKRHYREGRLDDARRLFSRAAGSPNVGPHALLWRSAVHVRQHHSVPALRDLLAVLERLERSPAAVVDETRVRDTALAALVRIYYASAIRLDRETNLPHADPQRLSAAHKYFQRLNPSSPDWPEMAHEAAWLYAVAGDAVKSGGYLRALTSPAFPSRLSIRAEVLRAFLAVIHCQNAEARTHLERFDARRGPLMAELERLLQRGQALDGEAVGLLEAARRGRGAAAQASSNVVVWALAEPAIVGQLTWLRMLDEQRARLATLGRSSEAPVILDARADLDDARRQARAELGRRFREYLETERREYRRAAEDAAALREAADARSPGHGSEHVSPEESKIFGVARRCPVLQPFVVRLPDQIHRLESGYFYELQATACGR